MPIYRNERVVPGLTHGRPARNDEYPPFHYWYLCDGSRCQQDLDDAVLDRMDDSLLFPIPDKKSRAQLLVQVPQNKHSGVPCVSLRIFLIPRHVVIRFLSEKSQVTPKIPKRSRWDICAIVVLDLAVDTGTSKDIIKKPSLSSMSA